MDVNIELFMNFVKLKKPKDNKRMTELYKVVRVNLHQYMDENHLKIPFKSSGFKFLVLVFLNSDGFLQYS